MNTKIVDIQFLYDIRKLYRSQHSDTLIYYYGYGHWGGSYSANLFHTDWRVGQDFRKIYYGPHSMEYFNEYCLEYLVKNAKEELGLQRKVLFVHYQMADIKQNTNDTFKIKLDEYELDTLSDLTLMRLSPIDRKKY